MSLTHPQFVTGSRDSCDGHYIKPAPPAVYAARRPLSLLHLTTSPHLTLTLPANASDRHHVHTPDTPPASLSDPHLQPRYITMSPSVPADLGASSLLLGIPRECRHIIFGHVAASRTVKARDTLRNWFEKQDIQEQIAEIKKTDDGNVTYVAGFNSRYGDENERETGDEQEDTAGVDQIEEGGGEVEEEDEVEDEDEVEE